MLKTLQSNHSPVACGFIWVYQHFEFTSTVEKSTEHRPWKIVVKWKLLIWAWYTSMQHTCYLKFYQEVFHSKRILSCAVKCAKVVVWVSSNFKTSWSVSLRDFLSTTRVDHFDQGCWVPWEHAGDSDLFLVANKRVHWSRWQPCINHWGS